MDPLVSVITASYNRAEYLPLAIESVLGQTYRNIEYHIVDDGSTDDTCQVIQRYLGDNRVRYHYQANRGQSAARSRGVSVSTGAFVCFLDSDNIWRRGKIEMQLRTFDAYSSVGVVYGDIQHIDEHGNDLNIPNMHRYSGRITRRLLMDNFVTFNTAMVRRECFETLGGLDQRLSRSDDYELWLRFSTQYEFYYLPATLAKYRVWRNQLSSDKGKRFEAIAGILHEFMHRNPQVVDKSLQRLVWGNYHIRRGRHRAGRGDYRGALKDYAKAIQYMPTRMGGWRALLSLAIRRNSRS